MFCYGAQLILVPHFIKGEFFMKDFEVTAMQYYSKTFKVKAESESKAKSIIEKKLSKNKSNHKLGFNEPVTILVRDPRKWLKNFIKDNF